MANTRQHSQSPLPTQTRSPASSITHQQSPNLNSHQCAGCSSLEQVDLNVMMEARANRNLPGWHWVLKAVSSPPMFCKSEGCLGVLIYASFNNDNTAARTKAMLPFRLLLNPVANGWPHCNPGHFYHAVCAERILYLGKLAKEKYMVLAPQFLPGDNEPDWPPMIREWFSRDARVDLHQLGNYVAETRDWLEKDRACRNLFRAPSCWHSAPPCEACFRIDEDSNPDPQPLIGEYDIDAPEELTLGVLLSHQAAWTQFSGTGYLGPEFE